MRAQFRSNRAECRFAAKCWIDKYSRTAESNSLGLQARAGLKGKYWLFVQLTYFSFPKISADVQCTQTNSACPFLGKECNLEGKALGGKCKRGGKEEKSSDFGIPLLRTGREKNPNIPFSCRYTETERKGSPAPPQKDHFHPFPYFFSSLFFDSDFPGNWPSVPFPFSPLLPPLPILSRIRGNSETKEEGKKSHFKGLQSLPSFSLEKNLWQIPVSWLYNNQTDALKNTSSKEVEKTFPSPNPTQPLLIQFFYE